MNLLKYILAALALVLGAVLVPTLANAEDSGEPCVETEDRTETAWFETDPGAPWVATGESRDKTPAGEGTVQTSDWLTEPPAGEGWQPIEERTVNGELVSDAVDQWWHWNQSSDPTAIPPADGWARDAGDRRAVRSRRWADAHGVRPGVPDLGGARTGSQPRLDRQLRAAGRAAARGLKKKRNHRGTETQRVRSRLRRRHTLDTSVSQCLCGSFHECLDTA